jgi:5-dehydro-4-deoxyglucarate dehydratase
MKPQEFQAHLRGLMAYVPTPFTRDDRVDVEALSQHVRRLCHRGVPVVVACGGTGEFFSLEFDEYVVAIEAAVAGGDGHALIVPGIGHSTRTACRLAEHAASAGVDGLMIHPPYFFEPDDDGVVSHYRAVGAASGLGLIAFSRPGAVYDPARVERLASLDSVVAFKDEVGDLGVFLRLKERLGGRLAWINGMAEGLAGPYFAAGADAMTSGIVNFAPELSLAVWNAGVARRWEELEHLVSTRIRPLAAWRQRSASYQIAVVKEAMNLLGFGGGCVRSPVMPMTADDREALRATLGDVGLIPSGE